MPKVGHGGMGTILNWIVSTGQAVSKGETLAEAELEKVTIEIESPAGGRLVRIMVPPGQEVEAGTVIAHIDVSPT